VRLLFDAWIPGCSPAFHRIKSHEYESLSGARSYSMRLQYIQDCVAVSRSSKSCMRLAVRHANPSSPRFFNTATSCWPLETAVLGCGLAIAEQRQKTLIVHCHSWCAMAGSSAKKRLQENDGSPTNRRSTGGSGGSPTNRRSAGAIGDVRSPSRQTDGGVSDTRPPYESPLKRVRRAVQRGASGRVFDTVDGGLDVWYFELGNAVTLSDCCS
jgi:hypothetical protein